MAETVKQADEFTEEEIYMVRSYLARRWRQSISQVTEVEAKAYLRVDRSMRQEFPT